MNQNENYDTSFNEACRIRDFEIRAMNAEFKTAMREWEENHQ